MSARSAPLVFQRSLTLSAFVSESSLCQESPIFIENFYDIVKIFPFGIIIRKFGLQSFETNPSIFVFDEVADIGLGTIKKVNLSLLLEYVWSQDKVFFSVFDAHSKFFLAMC